jgi:hypothetical protein
MLNTLCSDTATGARGRRRTGPGRVRNLIKYNYYRTVEPERDWRVDPGWDMSAADFAPSEGDRARGPLQYGGEVLCEQASRPPSRPHTLPAQVCACAH